MSFGRVIILIAARAIAAMTAQKYMRMKGLSTNFLELFKARARIF